ncbi:MAG: hypothetical protein WC876_02635 [Candidatus Thermoplasmatota archaeon]|jgi:hypothetical protein
MDDPPRWSSKPAVVKQDQFTAAPQFIDGHGSEHLPMWGRLQASWHGMAPQRRVLVAASIIVFTGAIAALALFTAMDLAGPETGPSQDGLAAEGPDAVPPSPSIGSDVQDVLNSTAPSPSLPAAP